MVLASKILSVFCLNTQISLNMRYPNSSLAEMFIPSQAFLGFCLENSFKLIEYI